MANVSSTVNLPVPAQTVWAAIGQFNALPDWHPAVEKSEVKQEGSDRLRTLSLVGGGTIVEKLEAHDDKERVYSYSIQSSPLPVTNYQATLKVRQSDSGIGCTVEWSSEFEADGANESEAQKAVRGIYEAGFQNLQKMFGG